MPHTHLRLTAASLSVALAFLIAAGPGRTQTSAPLRLAVTPTHATSLNPTLSGDGRRVAFESTADPTGEPAAPQFRAYVADVSGATVAFARLAATRAPSPALSQDGSRAAFASAEDLTGANPDRNPEIFLSEGATLRQLTETTPADASTRTRDGSFRPSISDDGRLVAFSSNRDLTGANADGNSEIFVYDGDARAFRQITNSAGTPGATDAKLGGDGTRLAYVRDDAPQGSAEDAGRAEDARRDLVLFDLGANSARVLAEDASGLAIAPGRAASDDGLRVVFAAEDAGGASQVFLYDGRNDAVRQLTALGRRAADVPLHPTISGDGSRVAFATRRSALAGEPAGGVDLYLFDLPANRLARVTNAPARATAEVVSSLDDAGSAVAFNFPRALADPAAPEEFANTCDIFLARLDAREPFSGDLEILHAASLTRAPEKLLAPGQLAVARGTNLSLVSARTQPAPDKSFPRSFKGVTVAVNGRPAQMFFVSPEQVNFQIPGETELRAARVVVRNHDGYESRAEVLIARAAPGVFTESADGRGAAVALDAANQLRGPFDPADAANEPRRLSIFATGLRGASNVAVSAAGFQLAVEAVIPSPDLPGLDEVHVLLQRRLAGAGVVPLLLTADGHAANATTLHFVGARRPARVALSPASPTLGVGRTLRFSAAVFDSDDIEIAGAVVAFSSSDEGVAPVDANGTLRAAAPGVATVRASSGELFATTEVRVRALSLVLNEALADPPDGAAGDANRDGVRNASQDEFVEIVNASDSDIALGGYRVSTRAPGGAETTRHVFAPGATLAPGEAAVVFGGASQPTFNPTDPAFGGALVQTASAGGLSLVNGGATLTLRDPSGAVVEELAYGEAGGPDADRNQSLTRAPDVTGDFAPHQSAAADPSRAYSPGTRLGGGPFLTNTPVARVEIAPAEATIQIGDSQQFNARAFGSDGRELRGVIFIWQAGDAAVASIDERGLARGVAPGRAEIFARARGVESARAVLTVAPPPRRVTRVEVLPPPAAINRGGTHAFTARAFDASDQVVADAVFAWASRDDSVASVDRDGRARGVGMGLVKIVASTPDGAGGSVEAEATLEVRVPVVLDELLADVPPDDATTAAVEGDANRDGLRRADDDEFVELLNTSDAPVDLSGLRLSDVTSRRFVFPANTTLAPGRAALVFGGGSPPATDPAFGGALIFAAPSLGLNDGGDTLSLTLNVGRDEFTVFAQSYGSQGGPPAPPDQSLTLSPDAGAQGGELVPHTSAANSAGRVYSPGTRADGTPFGSLPLTRIELVPSSPTLDIGAAQTFTARAYARAGDSETEIPNVSFAWESSDPAKASLAPRSGAFTAATARAAGRTVIVARAGGLGAESALTINPPPPVLTRIEVTPEAAAIVVGGARQFIARGFDQSDAEMPGLAFAWTTSDPAVASIDAGGRVVGLRPGAAQIRASARGVTSPPAALTVARRITRVEVSPAASAINRGGTQRFFARAFDQDGQVAADATLAWSSSDATVAPINSEGLARGLGAGSVEIRVSTPDGAGGVVSATARLEVRVPVILNEVLADVPPDDPTTAAVEGDANRDGVRGSGDDEFVELFNVSAAPVDLSGLRLSDATGARFTFPANTSLEAGRAAVVFGGGSPPNDPAFGGALIFVASALSLNDGGDTVSLKLAVGSGEFVVFARTYGTAGGPPAPANQSLTRAPDASADDAAPGHFAPHLAAPGSQGRGFSPGTRADGTPFGSPLLTRIELAPAAARLDIDAAQAFTARAFAAAPGGAEVEIPNTSFLWDVSDATKASVAPATGGRTNATARAAGTLTVRARAGGLLAEAALTVNPPPPVLTRIKVTPETAAVVTGGTQQFVAQAFDQFDAEMTGVTFSWAAGDQTIAAVDAQGLARGLRSGTTQIRASAGAVTSEPAALTVSRRVARVEVSPGAASINRGGTQRFTARAFYEDGEPAADAPFSWRTSNPAAASVNAEGLAVGAGAGSVTVTATTADGAGGLVDAGATLEVRVPVVLNEFLADVPPDSAATIAIEGDANRDGARNSGGDEFVELLNASDAPVDLSGLRLSDATNVRFTFPVGTTLAPGRPALVFGGGSPPASDPAFGGALVFVAGALGLNDGGDTVSLRLAVGPTEFVVFTQTYGTAGGPAAPADQSLTRAPDASPRDAEAASPTSGDFAPHADAPGAQGRVFSPGTRADGTPFGSPPLTRIEITPASADAEIGGAQTFAARAFSLDAGGAEVEIANVSFNWDASDPAKAVLAPTTGPHTAATALAAGQITIRARAGARQATAALNVNPPPPILTRVELTPQAVSLGLGQSRQFTARAFDQYDAPFPVNSLAFSSSAPGIVSLDPQNFTPGGAEGTATARALAAGGSQLTATANDGARSVTSAAATVTVEPPPVVPTAGQVIVNEALISFSTSAAQPRADFVELYNTTDQTLDISGLVIRFRPGGNTSTARAVVLPGAVGSDTLRIRPRGYFIVVNGAQTFGAVIATTDGRPDGFDASKAATDASGGAGAPPACASTSSCFDLNGTAGGISIEIGGVKLDGMSYQSGASPPPAPFNAFGEGPPLVFSSGATNDLVRAPNAADTGSNAADFRRNGTAASVTPKAANP